MIPYQPAYACLVLQHMVTLQVLYHTILQTQCRFEVTVLFVGCLTSRQQARVSQGRICSDNCTCCHTETEAADQTFYLTQLQYTDIGPTSPSAEPLSPGAWQGSQWSVNFEVTGMTQPRKNPGASGIRTRDLPFSRRTPYHSANEAVFEVKDVCSLHCFAWTHSEGSASLLFILSLKQNYP